MIKKITTSIVVLYSVFSFAQQSTSSPYSYFGIGETKFKGTPEQRAMGGLGILPDSTHINLLNPASYSTLKLTAISVGGGTTFNKMSSDQASETAKRTSLDYLAVGIPMGKFGAVLGLNPQTAVGYKVQTISQDNTTINHSVGEGGSNRVFMGGAYQITPKLSFGVDASYNFGTIETINDVYLTSTLYSTRVINNLDLSGFNFNLGLMYRTKIKEKYEIYTSAVYSPSYNMDITRNKNAGTLIPTNSGSSYDDYIEFDQEKESYTMPSKVSLGAGVGVLRKWLVGAEITQIGKSPFNTPLSGGTANLDNKNATRFSLGGYYIPKYNSFTNYFHRVTYRAGVRYENTGLVVNNQTINDMGVSAGLGLPVGNGFSDLTLAFEYGQRGTKSAGLVQENYFNISIGLTITDRWFRKFLYD